jgi:hypothetical protein
MNNKIKIGDPHIYFKMRYFANKLSKNAEAIFILAIVMTAFGLVVRAFVEGDMIIRLSMTAIFFASTTFMLALWQLKRRIEG